MKLCFLSGLKEIVGREELETAYSGRLSGLLEVVCERYGEALRALLFDAAEGGRRSPFLKILVDGKDVGRSDPVLSGKETIILFLPIAGG